MTKDKKKNIKKMKNEDLVAISLRLFASTMIANPENFSEEQGKILDRALRSCACVHMCKLGVLFMFNMNTEIANLKKE